MTNEEFYKIINTLDSFKAILSRKEAVMYDRKIYVGIESYNKLEESYIYKISGLTPEKFKARFLKAASFFS